MCSLIAEARNRSMAILSASVVAHYGTLDNWWIVSGVKCSQIGKPCQNDDDAFSITIVDRGDLVDLSILWCLGVVEVVLLHSAGY
jgi:hypothetical protein